MKRKTLQKAVLPRVPCVLDIPIDCLLFDPNQPRKQIDAAALAELAESIRSQGLQQLPVVNPAYTKGGKPYYYIKAGERRYRAHLLLKKGTVRCFVETDVYDGTFDIKRKLAQAAENSSREPHTHSEIVLVMEEVVKDELIKRDGKAYGTVEIAMGRVSQAFGKSRSWAINYYALTHLHPELRDMLDSKNDEERLNFNVAIALSRIPAEQQQELLTQAKGLKEKGGHALMYRFIIRQARALRKNEGLATRGRRPSEDRALLVATINGLYRQAVNFFAERHSSEHQAYVKSALAQIDAIKIDQLLHKLDEALITFQELRVLTKKRRDALRQGLRIVTR